MRLPRPGKPGLAMTEREIDSRVRGNDRGIKTNNIYLQTIVRGTVVLTTTPH